MVFIKMPGIIIPIPAPTPKSHTGGGRRARHSPFGFGRISHRLGGLEFQEGVQISHGLHAAPFIDHLLDIIRGGDVIDKQVHQLQAILLEILAHPGLQG